MRKDTKVINVEVSFECWKKLKLITINRDTTLQIVINEILEKSVSRKTTESIGDE